MIQYIAKKKNLMLTFLTLGILFSITSPVFAAKTTGRVSDFQLINNDEGGKIERIGGDYGFGGAVANIGDLDDDGINDIAVGAVSNDDGGNHKGAVYILFLNADGTVKAEQEINELNGGFQTELTNNDSLGSSIAGIGDLDGDGVEDIVTGAIGDDDVASNTGAVYVLFMNTNGTVKAEQKISMLEGGLQSVLRAQDNFGIAAALIGDVDGDGVQDIAVSATGDDDVASDRMGAIYILFLNTDGTVKDEQKIGNSDGNFAGQLHDLHIFGASITSIGDFDNDGTPDIAVGAGRDNDGGYARGAVFLLFLNPDGTVKEHKKISSTVGRVEGLEDVDLFSAVTAIGDANEDGVMDIAVGTFADDDGGPNRGAIYVLFLNADGTVKSQTKISDTQGGFEAVLDNDDFFAYAIASGGDINGDGVVDLISGAYEDDGGGALNSGAVYVLFLQELYISSEGGGSVQVPSNMSIVIESNPECVMQVGLTIQAENANRVVLSSNPEFVDAQVVYFNDQTETTWSFAESSDLYAIFISVDGVQSSVMHYSFSTFEASCFGQPEEEESEEESPEIDLPSTGISPATGELESISIVEPGDLIRGYSYDTIYLVTKEGGRRPFFSEQTFFTHYSDFSQVKTVTDATLAVLPLGAPVLPKAGVVLMKIQSDPSVYAIEEMNGEVVKRKIPNEAVATAVYGSDWGDYVIDVEPTLYARFVNGAEIAPNYQFDASIMKKRSDLHDAS